MSASAFDVRIERSLVPVVARWADQDKALLRPLFALLADGQPVEVRRLARTLNRDSNEVEATLRESLASVDARGRVTELFGVTHELTSHRIEIGGTTVFSCCALVAHILPALIGRSARIESIDPVSGRVVILNISDQVLERYEPVSVMGSMVDTDPESVKMRPRSSFCCHVKHFATRATAQQFSRDDSTRYVLPIEDFHRAAQWLGSAIWQ